ncbi:hypothetical protein ACFLRP_00170 [Bacteroidota bacterium]
MWYYIALILIVLGLLVIVESRLLWWFGFFRDNHSLASSMLPLITRISIGVVVAGLLVLIGVTVRDRLAK